MASQRQINYINSLLLKLEKLGHNFDEQRKKLEQGLSHQEASVLIDELHEHIVELYPGHDDFLTK